MVRGIRANRVIVDEAPTLTPNEAWEHLRVGVRIAYDWPEGPRWERALGYVLELDPPKFVRVVTPGANGVFPRRVQLLWIRDVLPSAGDAEAVERWLERPPVDVWASIKLPDASALD